MLMAVETIGIGNLYRVYIDHRRIMDIQYATRAYPMLVKEGRLREVVSESIARGIAALVQGGDPESLLVASVLAAHKDQILESVCTTVQMQYQEDIE